MKTIKAVLIDFDGTLADTNEIIVKSFQHVYRTFQNREEDREVILATFGEPLRETMVRVFGSEYEDEAVEVYRSFQARGYMHLVEPFPGMAEAVKELKSKGYKIGLVTSRIRSSALTGLEKFGLTEDFDVVTTITDIIKRKPDPESILKTLEPMGITPEEAVMVGDSKFDILCAQNAGCRSVLVDWSVSDRESRREMNADFTAETAEALIRWIEEN